VDGTVLGLLRWCFKKPSGSATRRSHLLARADLARADLARADLARADLARADLARADLARADLDRADLDRARLGGAGLERQAVIGGTTLTNEAPKPAGPAAAGGHLRARLAR